jgi:hypothetical protein
MTSTFPLALFSRSSHTHHPLSSISLKLINPISLSQTRTPHTTLALFPERDAVAVRMAMCNQGPTLDCGQGEARWRGGGGGGASRAEQSVRRRRSGYQREVFERRWNGDANR